MLCLKTLGGLGIERGDQPLPSTGPRRRLLALLALIAGHEPPGISRDKLLAYLWPESDTQRARNSLKQGLYSLRQSLGIPLVNCAGGVLRLNRRLIEIDTWQFEATLVLGEEAKAVSIYRGPYLDGFYIAGLDELERWMEAERERLARRYGDALRVLAERAEANRDTLAAAIWWRRLTAAEPLCSTAALGLMRALAAAGDITSAREHARVHAAYVRAELGGPVAEAVVAFANRLRDEPGPREPTSTPARALAPARVPPIMRGPERRGVPIAAGIEFPPALSLPAVPRLAWWGVAAFWAVALLLNAFGPPVSFAAIDRLAGIDQVTVAEPTTIAVAPFSVAGGPESRELGRGLEELLEARLDGVDGLRTVSAGSATSRIRAARLYVRGRLIVAGGRLRAAATIYDRGNANIAVGRAEAEVGGNALFDLADALASQLIAERYRGPHERLTKVAATSTRSLPALKAYLTGERRFQADNYPAAVDAFKQAIRADTAFALAYYRLSLAADWEGRRATALWAAELAVRYSDRLSEHDRRLVEAYLVQRRGRVDEAERRYREIVADFPEDAEAWFQLGEVLFRANPLRGRSAQEARPALERVIALEPGNKEALVHLARIAALEGDQKAADSLIRRTRAVTPDSAVPGLRAFRTFALGDRPGRNEATRELIAQPGLVPATIALQAAVYVDDLAASERFAELLASGRRSCELRGLGRRMLAQAQLARGHPALARARLASPEACDSAASLELRTVYDGLPFVRVPPRELKAVRRALEEWKPSTVRDQWQEESGWPAPQNVRLYGLGLISLRSGDTLPAHDAAVALARRSDGTPAGEVAWSFSRSLRARLALERGRPAQALASMEDAGWERSAGRSVAEASDRFLRAELLRQLGRVDEAIGWYRSIAERSSYELVYLAPAQFRLGQIYDRRGNAEEAISHYRRFRELWQYPDPELRPMVTEAERRLKSLAGRSTN
jgi:DNA-binding SARP family transcriptional activator